MGRTWCQGMKNEWQKIRYCRSIQLRSNWPWIHAREAESKQVTDESTTSCRLGAHGFRDTTDARGSDQMRALLDSKIRKSARSRLGAVIEIDGLLVEKGSCGSRLVAPRVDVQIFFCNPSILHRNGTCGLRLWSGQIRHRAFESAGSVEGLCNMGEPVKRKPCKATGHRDARES